MYVSKELQAVDSPLSQNKEIKLHGVRIKVSDAQALNLAGAKILGYTFLEKTNAMNLDRVRLTDKLAYLIYFKEIVAKSIQYGICVDDIKNEWIVVVSDSKASAFDKKTLKQIAAGSVFAVGIAVIVFSLSKKSESVHSTTEVVETYTTEIESGGYDVTYRYGAPVEGSTQTAEAILNTRIASTKDAARKEKKSLSKEVADDLVDSTDNSQASASNESGASSEEGGDNTLADELPYTKPRDTVIVPSYENDTHELEDSAVEISLGGGDITLSSGNTTATFNNPYGYTLYVNIIGNNFSVPEFSIAANSKTVMDLGSVIKESTSAILKYEKEVDGKRSELFEIPVNILIL